MLGHPQRTEEEATVDRNGGDGPSLLFPVTAMMEMKSKHRPKA